MRPVSASPVAEGHGHEALWPARLLASVALSFLFGLLATTLVASLTFWRDFTLVRERQAHVLERLVRHERTMEDQAANIHTQQSLNAEQQFQLNQCLGEVREIRRLLRFDPGYP